MFDQVVQDFGSRFDLGGKAGGLTRSVLSYMFSEESGGMSGLLERFRKAGMGDLVNSWTANSAPRELTKAQLEGALGGSAMKQIADRAGLSVAQVTTVLPFLLPKLIGMLTSDGKVPSTMPAAAASWLGGSTQTVGSYRAEPAGAGATVGTYSEPAGSSVGVYREPMLQPVGAGRSTWLWLLPLLLLGALGVLWAGWSSLRSAPQVASERLPMMSPPTATTDFWPVKIHFATGSATIEADDSARVQRAADYLKANPGAVVDITGFTDKAGAAGTNDELARERARAVRGALAALGIPESRTNLAPPVPMVGSTNDADARRVEIRPRQ